MPRKAKLGVQLLESRITPGGDPTVASVGFNFPNGTVPGAKGTVSITLENADSTPDVGLYDVKFEMVDPTTQTVIGAPVATIPEHVDVPPCGGGMIMPPGKEKITIKGGTGTKDFSLPALDPANPNQYKPGMYQLRVTFGQNSALSQPFDYEYKFGQVTGTDGKIKSGKMTVKGTDGDATFSMTGPGTGTFTVGTGTLDLAFTKTDGTSVVTETGGGGVQLRDISADALIKTVKMPDVSAENGFVEFNGGLGQLQLNDFGDLTLTNKSTLTIASGWKKPATLAFNALSYVDITANDGINLLYTRDWTSKANSPSPDVLTAPFVNTILDAADFDASLHITAADPNGIGLRKTLIGGTVTGTWQFDGANAEVKDIYANKAEGLFLTAPGHVDKLTIGSDFVSDPNNGTAVKAGTIGNLQVVGNFLGAIDATGADATNIAINSFQAGGVLATSGLTADTGGIQTIETGGWEGASLDAKWIKTLTAKPQAGSFFDATVNLTGTRPGQTYSLDSAKIGGALGMHWNLSGDVNSITADSTNLWSLTASTLGSLAITNELDGGIIDAHSIGSISVGAIAGATIKSATDITSFQIIPGAVSTSYLQTNVEAKGTIGTVVLRDVNPTTTACHVQAKEIKSYSRFAGVQKKPVVGPIHYTTATPKPSLDTLSQFSVLIQ